VFRIVLITMAVQLKFFYDDYQKGSSIASSFDDKVKSDSLAYGQDYLSLTSLAVRQAFGAIEFTNTPAEPLLFMKEISSDGNVNTADGETHRNLSFVTVH
jgi:hypothetical protein